MRSLLTFFIVHLLNEFTTACSHKRVEKSHARSSAQSILSRVSAYNHCVCVFSGPTVYHSSNLFWSTLVLAQSADMNGQFWPPCLCGMLCRPCLKVSKRIICQGLLLVLRSVLTFLSAPRILFVSSTMPPKKQQFVSFHSGITNQLSLIFSLGILCRQK